MADREGKDKEEDNREGEGCEVERKERVEVNMERVKGKMTRQIDEDWRWERRRTGGRRQRERERMSEWVERGEGVGQGTAREA